MTDDEVFAWVSGPRLSQGGKPIVDKRTLDERIADMTKSSAGAGDTAYQNAQKIIAELTRRKNSRVAMVQAEADKQKAYAVTEGVEAKTGLSGDAGHGPADLIRKFAGLPNVTRRAGRKKTRKSKRKTRKSRV